MHMHIHIRSQWPFLARLAFTVAFTYICAGVFTEAALTENMEAFLTDPGNVPPSGAGVALMTLRCPSRNPLTRV